MAAHVEKTTGHQNHDQHQRQDNQKVADLHHGSLEVRDASGASHQFRRASKKGIPAGRRNYGYHFSLFNDGAGVCVLTRFLAHRQGFSRQRGLVDADVVALDKLAVGGDNIAEV